MQDSFLRGGYANWHGLGSCSSAAACKVPGVEGTPSQAGHTFFPSPGEVLALARETSASAPVSASCMPPSDSTTSCLPAATLASSSFATWASLASFLAAFFAFLPLGSTYSRIRIQSPCKVLRANICG